MSVKAHTDLDLKQNSKYPTKKYFICIPNLPNLTPIVELN